MADIAYIFDVISLVAAIIGGFVFMTTITEFVYGRRSPNINDSYTLFVCLLGVTSFVIIYGFLLSRTQLAFLPDFGGVVSSLPLPALAGIIAICLSRLQKRTCVYRLSDP